MAAVKKVTTKPEVKATETAVKTAAPKTEEKAVKPVVKAEEKKVVAPAPVVKVEEKKAEVKKPEVKKPEAPTKKEAVKKAEKKPVEKKETKKAEFKAALHVQFAGKSYAEEDLMKMAKDVWKYDLKQKAGDLVSVELYVKPEENMVYYVMNKDFTGSFYI